MKIFTQKFWSETYSNAQALAHGIGELAETASLMAVSGFTVWLVLNFSLMGVWTERLALAAASIVTLRALAEIAKDAIGIARTRADMQASAKKFNTYRSR